MSTPPKDAGRAQILVVEDSSVFREMQGLLLRQAGFGVWLFENPQTALTEAATRTFDLVIIDYELPEMNGEQFMHALRKMQPDVAVIFVSGSLTLDLAIKLSSQGVAGIFNKPANPKTLLEKINETLSRAARDTAVRAGSSSPVPGARPAAPASVPPPAAGDLAYEPAYVFGQSDAFREFTHRLRKVRDFRANLLLQGEPGSPFELFARELASISLFRNGPVMLCDAREFEPRRLIEVLAPSLLSHDAGTLIVTGVEELTEEQQKTLENLTTGRDVFLPFARRFRLVLAATTRLSERVEDGSFGDTLFYKISSLSLTVPSLRELQGDIALNAQQMLAHHHATQDASAPAALSPEASAWLEAQEWPGNFAQLSRVLLLAAQHNRGSELDVAALEAALQEETEHPAPAPAAVVTAEPVAVAPVTEPPVPSTTPETVAAAPAEELKTPEPARSAANVRVLGTQSLFRPASTGYNFGKRLAESIALADACSAA
jgi:DNA-binding NtrC family response regulator